MKLNKRTLTAMLLVCAQTIVLAQPPAPPAPRGPLIRDPVAESLRGGRILMNYENIDLRILARIMSELTGKNIVLDDKVQGRITVLSTREVTAGEAYALFRAALERYGLSVVERRGFVMITQAANARQDAPLTVNPRYPDPREGMTLGLVILRGSGDPAQLMNALRPLVTDPNSLQVYPNARALIVTDKASVVAKVAEVARMLDRATPTTTVSVILPRYAEAERLAPMLSQVMTRSVLNQGDAQPPKISGFAPTNALLVQGTPEQIREVKRLVERLDIPRAAPDEIERPQFYVHFLQYAQAEETAKIMATMLGERRTQQQEELQRTQNLPGTSTNPLSTDPGTQITNQPAGVPYPRLADGTTADAARTAAGDANQRISFVSAKVASDAETNSLILFVSPQEYKDVQQLLSELDVPRKQVLVLACVAELSLSKVLEQGARLQVATPNGLLSAYNAGLTEEGLLSALAAGNFAIGAVGGQTATVNVNGRDVRVPAFFAFLSANQNNTEFNLISSPRLLTADHKEAEMEVGDVVPFATGARFDNFGQPLVTYDYKDVGIKLKFTPHIAQSDTIRMDLDQQIQEVTDFLQQNLGGFGYVVPLISNRSVKTFVTLKEGETLLIGGLISKRTVETIQKVPILGDIPIIENFFKQARKEDRKTTLFVALTPYIINHPDEVSRLDRPYQEFLHGDRTPRDHEHEIRNTQASKHVVNDPYGRESGLPPQAAIKLADLVIQPPRGSDALRQGRVTVSNSHTAPVEFILVQTVRQPGGEVREARTNTLRLEPGENRQVVLPAYRFPDQSGVYEFDLSAVVGEEVVSRLPLPARLEVQGGPTGTPPGNRQQQ